MANTFTKAVSSASVGTTEETIYTVPSSTTGIVVGINLANVVNSQIKVTVKLNSVHLVKNVPVPAGSALAVLDGKLVVQAGDVIKVKSDTADSTDVIISILEQD